MGPERDNGHLGHWLLMVQPGWPVATVPSSPGPRGFDQLLRGVPTLGSLSTPPSEPGGLTSCCPSLCDIPCLLALCRGTRHCVSPAGSGPDAALAGRVQQGQTFATELQPLLAGRASGPGSGAWPCSEHRGPPGTGPQQPRHFPCIWKPWVLLSPCCSSGRRVHSAPAGARGVGGTTGPCFKTPRPDPVGGFSRRIALAGNGQRCRGQGLGGLLALLLKETDMAFAPAAGCGPMERDVLQGGQQAEVLWARGLPGAGAVDKG